MARVLQLYPTVEATALELEERRPLDKGCTRCALHERARSVCLGADGAPGGVLLVGDSPGQQDDIMGRPFVSETGKYLRTSVAKWWTGPVAYDNAVRCAPSRDFKDSKSQVGKAITACRGFLAKTFDDVQPTRIVTLGAWAALSVMGRSVSPFNTRRGYGYTSAGIPVFFCLHPTSALRNRFIRQWFDADIKWALTAAPPPPPPYKGRALIVENATDARRAAAHLLGSTWVSFDIESAGLLHDPSFRLLSIAVCARDTRDAFVWGQEALADPAAFAVLVGFLDDAREKKIGSNVKFDMVGTALAQGGRMPLGVVGDTRLWRKLLEPEASGALDDMAELVGMGGHKGEAEAGKERAVDAVQKRLAWERKAADYELNPLTKAGKARKLAPAPASLEELGVDPALERIIRSDNYASGSWVYSMLEKDTLYRYNALDAVVTTALGEHLEAELAAEPQLQRVWTTIVQGASTAVAQMERWGIHVDKDSLTLFDAHLAVKEEQYGSVLHAFAPDVNWKAPPQVAEFFYHKLGIEVPKLTDSGAESTDREALEEIKHEHPAVEALLNHRRIVKLRGTYASGMMPHIRPDGRIHPTILLDGARSGRTSCKDPNLQNIPRAESAEGKMARDIFIAPRGYKLVQLDYSQLELRVAAMLSGDELMLKIFQDGGDFHMATAQMVSQMVWGIAPELVEKKHRSEAKTVNFGAMYGQGDGALAKKLGISREAASRLKTAIFGRFRKLQSYFNTCLANARKDGVAWTWWAGEPARRRPLWRIADQDDAARSVAEHSSWNTPIQGTASDFCIASLVECVQWLLEDAVPAKLILAVHDSLMFEVREDAVAEVIHGARRIMQSHPSMGVPIVVDAEVGDAWGSLVKVAA